MLTVIIPTFKNKEIFLRNLKHNLHFLSGCEIIVINDDPGESIAKDVQQFKEITLIENNKNLGFGASINIGVKEAKNHYIMLLNSDVILKDKDYINALGLFKKNQRLFAVGFAQIEKNSSIVGKNIIYWRNGLFYHQKANNLNSGANGWAEGGSSIVDKEKFTRLGGFDSLFSPFYWEDIDLSYRAWKTGYQIFFDSSIVVKHHHQSTISAHFSEQYIKTIAFRNQFLFIWKNITDLSFVITHWLFLPFNLLFYLLKGEKAFGIGLIEALKKLSLIKKSRLDLPDKKIINQFSYEK